MFAPAAHGEHGKISLSIIYLCLTFGNFIVPPIIKNFNPKYDHIFITIYIICYVVI